MHRAIAVMIGLAVAAPAPSATETAAGAARTITAPELAEMVAGFSSDAMLGRAPATTAEPRALAWLAARFAAAGLEPAGEIDYLQAVSLVEITPDFGMRMTLGPEVLQFGDDFVAWTKRVARKVVLEDSELVFAGYGISAPEYEWDDWSGIDWEGKTAVVLVNDPGFATGDPALFTGRAMTYYGRWTYKYEEAARQGAAGLIIVHETAPAAYGWDVVRNSWSRPQFDLVTPDGRAERVKIEGWITRPVAERLFERAGVDFDVLHQRAASADFRPVPLGQSVSVAIENRIRQSVSHNVVGRLPGRETPEEYIAYIAHWDHLGEDDSLEGDTIYTGAADNASGVASLVEIAEAFAALPVPPRRSVLFLSVTAEEQGLLGARWFARQGRPPMRDVAAVLNMDIMSRGPPGEAAVLIGLRQSGLGDIARAAARAQGREAVDHPSPESGYFYRSDHLAFAQAGVPGLLFLNPGAPDSEYVTRHYHQPGDEFGEDWVLDAMVQDARLFFDIGYRVAESDQWPAWREDSEFASVRRAERPPRSPRASSPGE
jgi:Zn-dependent M28 family amino/carboxypeptidase